MGAEHEYTHCFEFPRAAGELPLAHVRAWIRGWLTNAWPSAAYDAELAATELLTNAYEHSQGTIVLRLLLIRERAVLRLEVEDGSPHLAPRSRPSPDVGQRRGRGLVMIDLLGAWGVVPAAGRKTVWVEIALA